jgi:ABC-type glycerol-3-phosphate transport system substrate-binding protein
MIELQKLSTKFEDDNPDIKLNWVVVEENILRQRVTTDVSTGSGQCDFVFIGLYETPIFAKRGWLKVIGNIPADLRYPFRPSSPCVTSASNSRHRTATHTAYSFPS